MCAHFQAVQVIPARRQKRALLGKRLQTLKVLLGHSAESEWSRQSLPFAHRADANNSRFEAVQGILGEHILSGDQLEGGQSRGVNAPPRLRDGLQWLAIDSRAGAGMAYNGKVWQVSVGLEGNLNLRLSLWRKDHKLLPWLQQF